MIIVHAALITTYLESMLSSVAFIACVSLSPLSLDNIDIVCSVAAQLSVLTLNEGKT